MERFMTSTAEDGLALARKAAECLAHMAYCELNFSKSATRDEIGGRDTAWILSSMSIRILSAMPSEKAEDERSGGGVEGGGLGGGRGQPVVPSRSACVRPDRPSAGWLAHDSIVAGEQPDRIGRRRRRRCQRRPGNRQSGGGYYTRGSLWGAAWIGDVAVASLDAGRFRLLVLHIRPLAVVAGATAAT